MELKNTIKDVIKVLRIFGISVLSVAGIITAVVFLCWVAFTFIDLLAYIFPFLNKSIF